MSLADLLTQPDAPPGEPTTLDETIALHAGDWDEATVERIIAGLEEQAKLWNQAQVSGSRKRVTSKNIDVPTFNKRKVVV